MYYWNVAYLLYLSADAFFVNKDLQILLFGNFFCIYVATHLYPCIKVASNRKTFPPSCHHGFDAIPLDDFIISFFVTAHGEKRRNITNPGICNCLQGAGDSRDQSGEAYWSYVSQADRGKIWCPVSSYKKLMPHNFPENIDYNAKHYYSAEENEWCFLFDSLHCKGEVALPLRGVFYAEVVGSLWRRNGKNAIFKKKCRWIDMQPCMVYIYIADESVAIGESAVL